MMPERKREEHTPREGQSTEEAGRGAGRACCEQEPGTHMLFMWGASLFFFRTARGEPQ